MSDSHEGDALKKDLAIGFETMRIISSIRFENLYVRVNPDLNVFLFQIDMPSNGRIMIVSSGFVG